MAVILGINAFHAGSSAALLVDGKPVAAIAEERLNRVKHYARFPVLAICKCLEMAGIGFKDIEYVAIGSVPHVNRIKKIGYALAHTRELPDLIKIKAGRDRLKDIKGLMASECGVGIADLRFKQFNIEHHLAHIASAYFISPWERCAGFSMDGSGDFATCMLARCEGDAIDIVRRVYVPHSLGRFYSMICEYIGYPEYGDEGKVMGLAPYGEDAYVDYFNDMIRMTKDSFRLNPKYFTPFGSNGGLMINESGEMISGRHYSDYMIKRFGRPREPRAQIKKRDHDIAFSAQKLFEKVYMHMLNLLHGLVPEERVSMAGGAAFNSVANGKVFSHTPFRETIIQPASGDEGLALGAALYASRAILKEKTRYVMTNPYLGPEYRDDEIRKALDNHGIPYTRLERGMLLETAAEEIEKGSIIGWFQGRMEWGPRALGNRSILASASLAHIKDVLNARVKHREGFRPFAPSVLAEMQSDIFEQRHPSPFMQHVYRIKSNWRDRIRAVCHVDNTGRPQSVGREGNPLYYDLIKLYYDKTGVPAILNTSFNENEPIVCSPDDAIKCFLRTRMDLLAIGPFICRKDSTC